MDADKRHQLKQNELAEVLGRIRDFGGDRQTRYWLLALVVVIVAVGGYRLWGNMRATRLANGWMELGQAAQALQGDLPGATDTLRSVIAETSDPALAASARIRLATALRRQADAQPDNCEQLLTEAATELRAVVDAPRMPAPLVATAAFSLGTTCEALGRFDPARIDEAAKLYEMIANDARFAGTPFTFLAENRLETIDELRVPVVFLPGTPPQPTAAQPSTAARAPTPEEPLIGPPAIPAADYEQPVAPEQPAEDAAQPSVPAEATEEPPATQPAPPTPGANMP